VYVLNELLALPAVLGGPCSLRCDFGFRDLHFFWYIDFWGSFTFSGTLTFGVRSLFLVLTL